MSEDTTKKIDLKLCECNCGELIPCLDKKGRPRRFKYGHGSREQFNSQWKNRKIECKDDYERDWAPTHPNSSEWGYILTHVRVMSEHLGRPLKKGELVHHKDGNKKNNHISNLQIVTRSEHATIHMKWNKHGKKDLSKRICKLCNSKTTYLQKTGWELWYKFEDGYICNKCKKKIKKIG